MNDLDPYSIPALKWLDRELLNVAATQKLLGAKWPISEYRLTDIGGNVWRFVLHYLKRGS